MRRSVSVVMAVHNTGKFIRSAIASVLNQSFRDFEFIIVDDGSSDATRDILKFQTDPRIRILTQENEGLTVSLNRGIEVAQSKYIARMDGDDISFPFRFEKQIEFLEQHTDVVAVGGQVLNIDGYGGYLGGKLRPTQHHEIDRELLRGVGDVMVHPSVMLRADALRGVGGYDATYRTAQDLDLYLRLAEVGRLANLDNHVLMYRQHAGSTNNKKYAMQIENRQKIVEVACRRRQLAFTPGCLAEWRQVDPQEQSVAWAWQALANGGRYSAFRQALSLLRSKPLNRQNWKLLACAARGY